MLYLILYYFLITGICLWAGILFYSVAQSVDEGGKSLIHYLISGLVILTAIAQWIVLIFPTTFISLLLILLLLGFITIIRRKKMVNIFRTCLTALKQKSRFFFLCLLCFLIMILILNAGPVIMDDTGSYHIQMVKWIQEYGSVPGIANLHLRFGFNSSWFVSIALLSYPLHGLNTYLSLNGLLSLWFCYYILENFFVLLQDGYEGKSLKPAIGCLVILILCLINWPVIRGSATSSNYDFITTCCTVILFLDLFEDASKPGVEWLLWPFYLFTVRVINFPLLLLVFFYFLYTARPFVVRRLGFCIAIGFFLVAPLIIRNVILSGYAFFPVYQLDFFSPDWKVDRRLVIEISEYIKYFNRVNAGFVPVAESSQLHFPQWIGDWFIYLFPYDKLMTVLSFFGYGFILVRTRRIFSPQQKVFAAVMLIQLVSWFFIAPDPRFVQGCLLFGIYGAIRSLPFLFSGWQGTLKSSFGFIASCVLLYSLSKPVRDDRYRNFLMPYNLPVPLVQTIVLGNIDLHIPSKVLDNWNPRCYDTELPCLYKLDPRVEARGKAIRDGFRLRAGTAHQALDGEYKIRE